MADCIEGENVDAITPTVHTGCALQRPQQVKFPPPKFVVYTIVALPGALSQERGQCLNPYSNKKEQPYGSVSLFEETG